MLQCVDSVRRQDMLFVFVSVVQSVSQRELSHYKFTDKLLQVRTGDRHSFSQSQNMYASFHEKL